ncbi:MAG: cytochrome C [Deltaproteobacteria bacterium]|nr:cytochrome C [Deltaproteobacteria bacterium]
MVKAKVLAEDCGKCHEGIVLALESKGKAHQTLCLDCHKGHPPADMEIVPSCGRCHRDEPHFQLPGCITCHTDPHKPLEISFTRDITAPCLTCHEEQSEQLRDNPSIHSKFACTACHWFHGQIQPCQNCHLPHSDTMGADSCRTCHRAHMPLIVTYGDNTPSEDCGSCHTHIYATMAATWAKHRKVPCVACHAGRHGTIPLCQDCHGVPHPDKIWAKFKECSECHVVAHDLWATKSSTSKYLLEK